jgi:uncharacterized membrane protein YhaH (DUF805 family)
VFELRPIVSKSGILVLYQTLAFVGHIFKDVQHIVQGVVYFLILRVHAIHFGPLVRVTGEVNDG